LATPNSKPSREILFARFLAELLDRRFTIPGTSIRIGLDPIIGLIPGIGDALANLTGSTILLIAARLKVPKIVLARMGLNIAVNAVIGAIPVFGDIFSIWFRSNLRNAELLEQYAGAEKQASTAAHWAVLTAVLAGLLLFLIAILIAFVWLFTLLLNAPGAGAATKT
jgi:hypothetical protein